MWCLPAVHMLFLTLCRLLVVQISTGGVWTVAPLRLLLL
jgi:hypothetical protein